ncbi:uncharacterized protein LOC133829749 [Humulus lupulus]|uniref:uncharacterized protein LOC133829749 n=1 Tax=Humulus lupulus TaxID=3486 RepID=UPI002B40A305|nr:uncharacterized protein LOC133829749 [Humulus lupulus]
MASWDKVCLPKAFGGLGFRNGQRWNHAILAKYIWAVSEKHDVLWVINAQLLTFDNLLRFKVPLDSVMCPVCGVREESHSHLFFACSLSVKVLEILAEWVNIRLWPYEFDRWRDWLSSRNNGLLSHIYNMLFAAVVYCIWRNRNCCIFYLYSRTASSIAAEVRLLMQNRLISISKKKLSVQGTCLIAQFTM